MKKLIALTIILSVLFFVSCSTRPGITIETQANICYGKSIQVKRMLGCYKRRTMVAYNE